MLLVASGRTTMLVLGGYLVALISIQLGPPLYAILNYIGSIYSQSVQAAGSSGGAGVNALSLQTASPIYSNAISAQAVVSYLVVGVPLLAYTLANRMASFGSALVGELAGLQSTIGNTSSAAALGNAAVGDITMDQRVISPSTSSPWVSRHQSASGDWITSAKGRQAIDYLRNAGAVSNRISASVSDSDVHEASKAVEAARNDAITASTNQASALSQTVSHMTSGGSSSRSTASIGVSGYEELGRAADHLATLSRQVAASTGMSTEQVQKIAFGLSLGLGLPEAWSPVQASAKASADKSYSSGMKESEQKVQSALGADGLREFKQFADKVTHDKTMVNALASESKGSSEIAARLVTTTARVESAQVALSQREAVAERLSAAHAHGEEISVDLAQLPNSDLMRKYIEMANRYGYDSQALQIAFASELVNYGMTPNRHFSEGSAVPFSFGDVVAVHDQRAQATEFSPMRVTQSYEAGKRAVGPVAPPRIDAPEVPHDLHGIRPAVDAEQSVASEGKDRFDSFDSRNEITRDADGGVGTRKSQVVQNKQQIERDAKNTWSSLKDSGEKLRSAVATKAQGIERGQKGTPEPK
jgi:conjugal transfer mating pair stabilization protein TraG